MEKDLSFLGNLDAAKGKGTTPLDPASIPGFVSNKKADSGAKFKVRYQKLDMDELGDITELEKIETRAIRNEGVFVLSKKDYAFMDRIFVLISYMEEEKE